MIRIEVDEYCHACLEFSPEAAIPVVYPVCGEHFLLGDTIVKCAHKERCDNIKKHLRQSAEKGLVNTK